MNVVIKETDIIKAANEGMDEFVNLFSNATASGEVSRLKTWQSFRQTKSRFWLISG